MSDSTPNVGQNNVIFTINVKNNGTVDAANVKVKDLLPDGLKFVTATPLADYDAVTGVWNVGTITAGATATLTITVEVEKPGQVLTTATITESSLFDPLPGNDDAEKNHGALRWGRALAGAFALMLVVAFSAAVLVNLFGK